MPPLNNIHMDLDEKTDYLHCTVRGYFDPLRSHERHMSFITDIFNVCYKRGIRSVLIDYREMRGSLTEELKVGNAEHFLFEHSQLLKKGGRNIEIAKLLPPNHPETCVCESLFIRGGFSCCITKNEDEAMEWILNL